MWDQGHGRGRGFLAMRMLSRWHILSYTIDRLLQLFGEMDFRRIANHARRIRNTCEGDSDLKYERKKNVNSTKQKNPRYAT